MVGLLIRLSAFIASGLIFRLLSGIGISIFTMHTINNIFQNYIQNAYSAVGGFSPTVLAYMGVAGLDKCFTVIVGALTFAVYLRSLSLIFTRS